MKKIILYLLAIFFCLSGCKKTEEVARVRFAKIEFATATKYKNAPYIIYEGKRYFGGGFITADFGEKYFEVYKLNGEKVLDFKLNIDGPQKYYIYQPDSLTKPVLLTELPAEPEPPKKDNPLDDSEPAPEGYIQLRVINNSKEALPYEKLDVVLHAVTDYDPETNRDISVPLETFSLNGYNYNTRFFLFKRPVGYNYFKLSFIDHNSGKEIKDASGYLYLDLFGFNFSKQKLNNYAIEINFYETTDPEESKMAILRDGKYYVVYSDIAFQK